MLYEKIHCSEPFSQMHGAAVASIAVGKNVGVAPGAKLYYIASTYGHNLSSGGEFDASIIADCIYRVIEINKLLPAESKIRVISISRGYNKNDLGYEEIRQAIEDADREGIFVVTTTTYDYYGFILYGAERNYYDDPDLPEVYHLPAWDSSKSEPTSHTQNFYLVPSGTRTYASESGFDKYEFDYTGGLSWGVPWFAGVYALCCQVDPQITPTEFIAAVEKTSIELSAEYNGESYCIGKIVSKRQFKQRLAREECLCQTIRV